MERKKGQEVSQEKPNVQTREEDPVKKQEDPHRVIWKVKWSKKGRMAFKKNEQ